MAAKGPIRPLGVERRRHPRSPCMLDTSFRRIAQNSSVLPDESYTKCKTIDISEEGLLLEGDIYVPKGERLEVYIRQDDEAKIIAGEVEIVRAEKKSGKFRTGAKFIKKEII